MKDPLRQDTIAENDSGLAGRPGKIGKNDNLSVSIWRGTDKGKFSEYSVPSQDNQTVLDVVTWIQQHLEPTLSYRFACRVGMCGSCAMTVNGVPRWTCRTHVKKATGSGCLRLEPLRNLPVIKDLTCDMSPFFEKWVKAEGVFHGSDSREDQMAKIGSQDSGRAEANKVIECINCAVCYSACDTVTNNRDYLGPAALNRAWSLVCDSRDTNNPSRLHAVSGSGGCHNCHSQQSCQLFCPNELNPTASIASLKKRTTRNLLGLMS